MKSYGYDGRFYSKLNGDGSSQPRDGVALFWNTKVITLKGMDHVYYNSDELEPGKLWSQVGVIGRFERGHCGRTFLVAATHLKAKKSIKNERQRVHSLKQLLDKLKKMRYLIIKTLLRFTIPSSLTMIQKLYVSHLMMPIIKSMAV